MNEIDIQKHANKNDSNSDDEVFENTGVENVAAQKVTESIENVDWLEISVVLFKIKNPICYKKYSFFEKNQLT